MATTQMNGSVGELRAPVRNRYYYGKMLDVFHFELEQDYFNQKRWLINQRVIGWGVVCGLDVTASQDQRSLILQPGLAIDRCGREIVVTCPSAPVPLDPWLKPPPTPPTQATGASSPALAPPPPDTCKWLHVCLCYHECETDPEPSFGGDCDTDARCSSGAIRERYRIDICEGKIPSPQAKCNLSELFGNNGLDYAALARYITRTCGKTPDSCCIPLANIQLPTLPSQTPAGTPPTQQTPLVIDVTVRPVVLTNPLLFQLLLCCCGSDAQTPCSGSSY